MWFHFVPPHFILPVIVNVKGHEMERSLEKIEKKDLKRLLMLAKKDVKMFFNRNPKYIDQYENKEVIIALGQGGALHYIDGRNGVKDFDVWFFYPASKLTLPYRRRGMVDFGESKFGTHPKDHGYQGRRIDVLMRSDRYFNLGKPEECLINYLKFKGSTTSKLLSRKAMVGLLPKNLFGKVLWPSNKEKYE